MFTVLPLLSRGYTRISINRSSCPQLSERAGDREGWPSRSDYRGAAVAHDNRHPICKSPNLRKRLCTDTGFLTAGAATAITHGPPPRTFPIAIPDQLRIGFEKLYVDINPASLSAIIYSLDTFRGKHI